MRARVSTLLLFVALLLLAGCGIGPGGKGSIQFEELFEDRRNNEMQIERTLELDVDEDGEDEWLVLYRYDPYEPRDWSETPIQGIVYDAVPCDPPEVHSWRLPFFDNDHLGEGPEVEALMADWLEGGRTGDATNELIIEGPGDANTLTIFRYHDYQDDPCKPPNDELQGFSLLGYFRANGRIVWDPESKTVTTLHRTAYERSQLAIRSTYNARSTPDGETFIGPNGRPIAADEQSVDFMFGFPASPLDSPYPEKAVTAFYRLLGSDNPRAQSFLTENMQNSFATMDFGLGLPPEQVRRVLIYSITYKPDRDAEIRRDDRLVTMVVAAVNQQNQTLPARQVTWRLVGIPIRGESEDCEWRLAELLGSTVTDGLGMLLPAEDTVQ